MHKGTLFIISSPSGAGKSSLIKALIEKYNEDKSMYVSVSHTTRLPRPGEVDGIHYNFINEESFKKLIEDNSFYEWACVFGKYYGTSKTLIEQKISEGIDVILDIDWQGARQIRKQSNNVKTIFILPPSLEELNARLNKRGQDSKEVIEMRMSKAKDEISHYSEYDFCIVNDDFLTSLDALWGIINTTRHTVSYQKEKNSGIIETLL